MKKIGGMFVLLVLLASLVSAEITLSEPFDVYNLGDRLYISLDGLVGSQSGNLNIDLSCGDLQTNLVKISSRAFSTSEEQSYSVPYKVLNKNDLEIDSNDVILGECQVLASLGSKTASTKIFTISNEADVEISLDKSSYNPGDSVKVDIEVVKANSELMDGFVVASNASTFSKAVIEGKASEVFTIPDTAESGVYVLNVYAYDQDSSGELNSGSSSIEFKVNQVASSVITSISGSSVIPGNNFTFVSELYDQSGVKMSGILSVIITNPDNKKIEMDVKSGENVLIDFPFNSTAGAWNIETKFDDLVNNREFVVGEVQKVEFDLDGSILEVTNTGNSLYNKTIDIQIGDELRELNIKIKPGETRKFNLGAPSGKYEVEVNDGDTSLIKMVALTGNVVSISNFKNFSFMNITMIIAFSVIIIGSSVMLFTRKVHRKNSDEENKNSNESKFFSFKKIKAGVSKKVPKKIMPHYQNSLHMTNKSPSAQSLDSENYTHEDDTMIDYTKVKNNMKVAESSVTLKGEKHVSSVIALSVKNSSELNDNARSSLHDLIDRTQGKGLVDWRGDYIFILFSPITTRTYHNEVLASRVALDILQELNKYNKKFRDKIVFNVGVNSGEMIASKSGGRLKYASIGNTISFSKRIADSDSSKVLVSESIRKKLLRDLKVERSRDIGEEKVYELLEIKDRHANAEKLKELIRRME